MIASEAAVISDWISASRGVGRRRLVGDPNVLQRAEILRRHLLLLGRLLGSLFLAGMVPAGLVAVLRVDVAALAVVGRAHALGGRLGGALAGVLLAAAADALQLGLDGLLAIDRFLQRRVLLAQANRAQFGLAAAGAEQLALEPLRGMPPGASRSGTREGVSCLTSCLLSV
jgi:hypothetical protein